MIHQTDSFKNPFKNCLYQLQEEVSEDPKQSLARQLNINFFNEPAWLVFTFTAVANSSSSAHLSSAFNFIGFLWHKSEEEAKTDRKKRYIDRVRQITQDRGFFFVSFDRWRDSICFHSASSMPNSRNYFKSRVRFLRSHVRYHRSTNQPPPKYTLQWALWHLRCSMSHIQTEKIIAWLFLFSCLGFGLGGTQINLDSPLSLLLLKARKVISQISMLSICALCVFFFL